MAFKQNPNERSYGLNAPTNQVPQKPIVAKRAPTTADFARPGTFWIDTTTDSIYGAASTASNATVWTVSPASGLGAFTSATINPGNLVVTAGDATITAGDLTVTAGNATIGGDLTVAGTTTINGDFDLTSAALIDLVSTADLNPAIFLHGNGGTTTAIEVHNDTGTGLESIYLHSDVGGIRLYAPALANAAAIDIQADAGGLDVDVALQLSLTSSEAAADAIEIQATNGGVDLDGALQVNIDSSQAAAADSIRINASAADGGIDVDAGTGGIAIDSTGAISLDAAAASNFSVSGAGIDLTLASAAGRVVVSGGEDAANAIELVVNAGTSETISLTSSQGTGVDSLNFVSTAGGMTFTAGLASDDAFNVASTGGVDIDAGLQINIASSENAADAIVIESSAGGLQLLASGASAGEDIVITATGSSVNITSTEAHIDALKLNASAGGVNIDGVLEVNIASSEAAVADAVTISASAADGGITLDAGATPGVTVTNGTQSFQILTGSGSPNGSVTASQGSLYVDVAGATSTTILFVNTDGGTTWLGVGA